ncbi:MAG: SOS response-associated peptidase family protein, partial [Candidatus Kerfeldbacteria bacterium]|nr:SOS response-associated peptidase family protein [Candidatus Kerfeldbacteria bacterium]
MNPSKFLRVKEPGRYGKFQPFFNARPGELLPIVTEEKPKQLTIALWNYLPHWATEGKMKNVINARSESLFEKPYFRGAVTKHRCIVPADGFYEWQKIGTRR